MKILVFGDSQSISLKLGLDYILNSTSRFNSSIEKWKKEIKNHNFEFLTIPGYNFENVNISDQGDIIIPRYIYKASATQKLTDEIIRENKITVIDPTKYQAVIWAEGPNPIDIYWKFIGKKCHQPSLLTSTTMEYMFKKMFFLKLNSSSKIIYIGSPNRIEKDYLKKELYKSIRSGIKKFMRTFLFDTNSKSLKIHKRNIQFMKSYLNKKDDNVFYIFPPDECLNSTYEYTLGKYGLNPGKDSVHANNKYFGKILIPVLKKISNLNEKNIL